VKQVAARNGVNGSAVAGYKRVLQQVLENRPSGTRGRLAEALGKNRSFISQITNPSYSVPIPAKHIERIFEICHFLPAEKSSFSSAYARAHPRRASGASGDGARWREVVLRVPDFPSARKNKHLDELLKDTVQHVIHLIGDR
jgi:hypothetical protein